MILLHGTASFIKHVFIMDSTSTTGAGKTALAFGDITAYYVRAGDVLTALTMVDITTLGTWDSDVISDKLGFKKLHDTNAPGLYEVHFPDNILAVGATGVTVQLRATGAAPCNIEIELVSATRGLTGTALPAAAADAAGGVPISDAGGLDLDAQVKTAVDAIKAKTDNLPADPADQSAVEAAISALNDIAAADVLAETIEGAFDVTEAMRLILAAVAGFSSGGGTVTFILKNTANNKDRITATVDADGNRTGMVYDVT